MFLAELVFSSHESNIHAFVGTTLFSKSTGLFRTVGSLAVLPPSGSRPVSSSVTSVRRGSRATRARTQPLTRLHLRHAPLRSPSSRRAGPFYRWARRVDPVCRAATEPPCHR